MSVRVVWLVWAALSAVAVFACFWQVAGWANKIGGFVAIELALYGLACLYDDSIGGPRA